MADIPPEYWEPPAGEGTCPVWSPSEDEQQAEPLAVTNNPDQDASTYRSALREVATLLEGALSEELVNGSLGPRAQVLLAQVLKDAHDVATRAVTEPIRRKLSRPTSSYSEQLPVMRAALEEARGRLPEGSDVRETYSPFEFEFITWYDPALSAACQPPHNLPPIARTTGEWHPRLSHGDAADEVQKALVEHGRLLSDVYVGKYK